MLNKLNYLLFATVIGLAIYAILLNAKIHKNSQEIVKNKKQLYENTQINDQLKLELVNKTSNIFVDKFAREELKMHLPKRIYSLD
jgi:cell division protein FtsL